MKSGGRTGRAGSGRPSFFSTRMSPILNRRYPTWLVPVLFVVVMTVFYPVVDRFELDEDEGINLMKARMVAEGYRLYSEIWSDQPPLLTHLLAAAMVAFGPSVETGRFTVLAFAALLVGSIFHLGRMVGGTGTGAVALVLLLVFTGFVPLSIATMIGLPAIALAVAALVAQEAWHRTGRRIWLVLSGLLLALSTMTKLFTLYLLPVFVFGAAFGPRHRDRRWAPIIFLGAFAGVSLVLGLAWFGTDTWGQLTEAHMRAQGLEAFREIHPLHGFQFEIGLLGLGAIGSVLLLREGRWFALYPALWAGAGLVILLNHAPVWPHQRLLVTVPAALLAAVPVVRSFETFRLGRLDRGLIPAVLVVGLLGYGVGQGTPRLRTFFLGGDRGTQDRRILEKTTATIAEIAGPGGWVVTDRPMFVFRAGGLVPPPMAVVSSKRLRTGLLNGGLMMAAAREFDARVIYLDRFEWPDINAPFFEEFDHPGAGRLMIRREEEP